MKKDPCSKCPMSADCDGCMFDPSKNQRIVIRVKVQGNLQIKLKVKSQEYHA